MNILRSAIIVTAWAFAGCTTMVGTDALYRVPSDATQTCMKQCTDIGLELGAVAIMANNVGCICQPSSKAAKTSKNESSVAAGMATLFLQSQSARQQQQQQQNQRTSN